MIKGVEIYLKMKAVA